MRFSATATAAAKLRLVALNLVKAAVRDLRQIVWQTGFRRKRRNRSSDTNTAGPATPLFFASYATDENLKGSNRYCGGEKLLNNLVLLLRRHGYDAWMVSLDGQHANWLAEHAPFLSLRDFHSRKARQSQVRCITSWIKAQAFLGDSMRFYFWDQELGASSRSHFPDLCQMVRKGRIIRTAGVNRSVQAWHRAVFEEPAALLRQLVDEKYWKPDPAKRRAGRIGYFHEGPHSEEYIRVIRDRLTGRDLDFVRLEGVEREIIDQMQQCEIFLTINIGKSPLWGEGGPMTPQEAMACGTVPICFDLNGPWEFIQHNYNGVITSEIKPELMAEALHDIYQNPDRLAAMSRRCVEMTESSHTMESRWPAVRQFLDLPDS